MPKFRVTKCVDAYVHYEAFVEAKDKHEAREMAEDNDHDLTWNESGVSQYDETDYDNIEPELMEEPS